MRIALAGTRSFGVAVAQQLYARGVLDRVFAPLGDQLAGWAASQGLWAAEKVNVDDLGGVDLGVTAHSHDYIGKRSLRVPTAGWIGYHPSLLPRHRGRDAVEWTVRFRDPIAGGTVFALDSGVDTGHIVAQDWCHVRPEWDASDLWRYELFPMGVRLLLEACQLVDRCGVHFPRTPQDHRLATWEPSISDRPNLRRTELEALLPAGHY